MKFYRKKLEKAEIEIENIKLTIINELSRNENKAFLEAAFNESTNEHEIYIAKVPNLNDFKEEISIRVGIVIHLLRSSLDNLTYSLAETNTNNNIQKAWKIQFPICDIASEYFKKQRSDLSELSDTCKKIIESYQPYHRNAGRADSWSGPYIHQLTLLRDISNNDKHRSIAEILIDPNHFEFTKEVGPIVNAYSQWINMNISIYFETFEPPKMELGEIIKKCKVPDFMLQQPIFAGFARPNITLDEHRPLVPTLQRIASLVKLIHSEFD